MITLMLACLLAQGEDRFALSDPGVDVEFTMLTHFRGWWPDLRGRAVLDEVLGVEPESDEGPDFDFGSDGGFGDETFAPEITLEIGSLVGRDGTGSIRARWWSGRWSASHVLNQPGDFGGPVLPAGALVESEFELRVSVASPATTYRSRRAAQQLVVRSRDGNHPIAK